MYFLSKFYQSIKFLAALSGTAGSIVAIVYGVILSGGTVFIVGGSLCLANSLFNIVEIGKVNFDIRKQIDELKTSLGFFSRQNRDLHANIESLNKIRDQFLDQNQQLQKTLDASSERIKSLESLKDEYDIENKNLATQLETEKGQLIQFTDENMAL